MANHVLVAGKLVRLSKGNGIGADRVMHTKHMGIVTAYAAMFGFVETRDAADRIVYAKGLHWGIYQHYKTGQWIMSGRLICLFKGE